ncbi:hypothetical protein DPMN_011283 [Dreissena polymorpha]|uniref:Uncharacterized protein n=1 Tax=Dreissena polymorpha TaxID=45954 RepID=A0A9D4S2C1_DREPO|nr:hypothetical protein DPMN_011283 [Dreissena polymorpha]
MRLVMMPCDVPRCVSLKWGALAAEMRYTYNPHVIIGPVAEHRGRYREIDLTVDHHDRGEPPRPRWFAVKYR